jgi:hypothetical protein
LSGDQTSAPELRPQAALIDQTLHEHMAFLGAAQHRSACRCLFFI